MRTVLSAWLTLLTAGCFAPYENDRVGSGRSLKELRYRALATALKANGELCVVVDAGDIDRRTSRLVYLVHRNGGWSEPVDLPVSGFVLADQLDCALDERDQLHIIVGGATGGYFVIDREGRLLIENAMRMDKSATVHMDRDRFGDIIAVIGEPDEVRILQRLAGGTEWVLRSLPKPHRYPRIVDAAYGNPPVVLFGTRTPARLGESVEPIRAPRIAWYAVRGDTLCGNYGGLWYGWRPDGRKRLIAQDSDARAVIERSGHLLLSLPRAMRYSGPSGQRTFDGCRPNTAALHVDAAGQPHLLFVLSNRIEAYTLRKGAWQGDAIAFPGGKAVKPLWRERGRARAAAAP